MAKKFTIVNETQHNAVNQQPPNPNSKFKTFVPTRPKKCPLCCTTNKVTKELNLWKCKECAYTWQ